MKRTYDQKQAAAVLKVCTACGVSVYATQPFDPYCCVICRDLQAKSETRKDGRA